MESQLKFVRLLSLKEMAVRSLAVLSCREVWYRLPPYTRHLFLWVPCDSEWYETVKENILKLGLPESLEAQVAESIVPIGLQIRNWKMSNKDVFWPEQNEIDLPDPEKLCWTTQGYINRKKAAELLLSSDLLSNLQRYRIACYYCLENYIPHLWENLSRAQKNICDQGAPLTSLDSCWPLILRGEEFDINRLTIVFDTSNLTSYSQWAFEHSVKEGNKIASEYFFQRLNDEERGASLMRTVQALLVNAKRIYLDESETRYDVLCYLLSLMTPVQQMEIVRAQPAYILFCFLTLPWQDLFLENVGLIWPLIPPSSYNFLLEKVSSLYTNINHGFPELFQNFLQQSPQSFKTFFVENASQHEFLSTFLLFGDLESAKILFRNIDVAERVQLLFSPRVLMALQDSIVSDKLYIMEMVLREVTLSEGEKERLKEALASEVEPQDNWAKFLKILDEAQ